jgi:hypothetical protein
MALSTFRAALFAAKHFAAQTLAGVQQYFASLGAWGGKDEQEKPRKKKETPQEIVEPLPVEVIARLREEMLSASLAADVVSRAKARRTRADEEALILMI